MTQEFLLKAIALGLSGITGTVGFLAADAATGPSGAVETHMTLATAAVGCTVVLFAALKVVVDKLLKAKDDQIAALRARENAERNRADESEKRERALLAKIARLPLDPKYDPES